MPAVKTEYESGELGVLLRERRTALGRTLADVAAVAYVHSGTLSRYETGSRIPVHQAGVLDKAYEAEGVVATAIMRTSSRPWHPAPSERPQDFHAHAWPASHAGRVWVQLLPSSDNFGAPHKLKLQWGPWTRVVTLPDLGTSGVILWTGKAEDDQGPAPLSCEVTPPAFMIFGLNQPPGEAIDIRHGWTRAV